MKSISCVEVMRFTSGLVQPFPSITLRAGSAGDGPVATKHRRAEQPAKGTLARPLRILSGAAHIESEQADLQADKSVGLVVPTPSDPHDVAGHKAPETPIALTAALRSDKPSG